MPVTPDLPPAETVLAFDFGLRRIGVAVGQRITGTASAVATVANRRGVPDWRRIDDLIAQWQPQRLLVGVPSTADGTPGPLAAPIADFCEALRRYSLPLDTVDERLSSLEASEKLRASRRQGARGRLARGEIDAAAAAVIAERWLAAQISGNRQDSE